MSEPAGVENNAASTREGGVTGKGFKKGQSGNPGGRSKGLAKAIREMPAELLQESGKDGALVLARIAWQIVTDGKQATSDRIRMWQLLADRGWGKPPEFVPIESEDPLGLAEADAAEIAANLEARWDELAAKREKRAASE